MTCHSSHSYYIARHATNEGAILVSIYTSLQIGRRAHFVIKSNIVENKTFLQKLDNIRIYCIYLHKSTELVKMRALRSTVLYSIVVVVILLDLCISHSFRGRSVSLRSAGGNSNERPLGWSYRRYWYKPRPYRPLFVGKRNLVKDVSFSLTFVHSQTRPQQF